MYTIRLSGFTIVELLIVIVVVAILAALSMTLYTGIQDRAYSTKAISVVDSIVKASAIYRVEAGHFPPTSIGNVICVGEASDYPSQGIYGAGECVTENHRLVNAAFNANLKQIISEVPDGSLPSVRYGSDGARGVTYVSDPAGSFMTLVYAVKGGHPCPKGTAFVVDGDTYCQVVVED